MQSCYRVCMICNLYYCNWGLSPDVLHNADAIFPLFWLTDVASNPIKGISGNKFMMCLHLCVLINCLSLCVYVCACVIDLLVRLPFSFCYLHIKPEITTKIWISDRIYFCIARQKQQQQQQKTRRNRMQVVPFPHVSLFIKLICTSETQHMHMQPHSW